jgi:hypothetical protein
VAPDQQPGPQKYSKKGKKGIDMRDDGWRFGSFLGPTSSTKCTAHQFPPTVFHYKFTGTACDIMGCHSLAALTLQRVLQWLTHQRPGNRNRGKEVSVTTFRVALNELAAGIVKTGVSYRALLPVPLPQSLT